MEVVTLQRETKWGISKAGMMYTSYPTRTWHTARVSLSPQKEAALLWPHVQAHSLICVCQYAFPLTDVNTLRSSPDNKSVSTLVRPYWSANLWQVQFPNFLTGTAATCQAKCTDQDNCQWQSHAQRLKLW